MIDELARDVERLESLREAKDVQRAYAHLAQYGLWAEMAALFTADATVELRDRTMSGRDEIADWLRSSVEGASLPGALYTEVIEQPLSNLSTDGSSAQTRWNAIRFMSDGAQSARIEGGVYENDYRLDGGQWRISTMRFHAIYDGDYDTGWTNVDGAPVPIVPPHFSLDEAGTPLPSPAGTAPPTAATAPQLAARIQRLNDEDAVRNLQHSFGYYVDRRMWSDVVDLFTDDAVFRVDGEHAEAGLAGVRRALERTGPEGLEDGHLNDRPLFDVIVEVAPDGREAVSRGIEIGMLGDANTGTGSWSFASFRSRFAKDGDLWKLTEVHVAPLLDADYHRGFARGSRAAAERAAPPAFLDIRGRAAPATPTPGHQDPSPDLVDLDRRLRRSAAYDGAENVSSAYGFYIDDFQWREMAGIFAVEGNKQNPFAGYFIGRDRIHGAVDAFYGGARTFDALRERISFHWRIQPVILVSHDARSATIRTRLLQPRTAMDVTPDFTGFFGGMYPNDQAVLEDGTWRLWSLTIDEHYFDSPTWHGGWSAAQKRPRDAPNPPPSRLVDIYPPDILLTELGERMEGFRGGPGRTRVWPELLTMWFHYRNPVSGRTPEHFWPDCVPSDQRPETRMTAHGYELPPAGPSVDGIALDEH